MNAVKKVLECHILKFRVPLSTFKEREEFLKFNVFFTFHAHVGHPNGTQVEAKIAK